MSLMRRILPPTYCFIYLVAAIVLDLIFPILRVIPSPYNFAGIVPLILGIWVMVWADNLFKKVGTEVKPFDKPTILVIEGPFRISRHPMYLGFVVLLIGVAIMLGSLAAFLAPAAMFITLATIFIPFEEKRCETTFGQAYLGYKRRVRCWF